LIVSKYLPGAMTISSPAEAALIASWMVGKSCGTWITAADANAVQALPANNATMFRNDFMVTTPEIGRAKA
jgi:hypothetical protein